LSTNPIIDYIHALENELKAGDSTEHTHRPALKILLQSLIQGITATNEPQHITTVGAPDFRVRKKQLTIGYVETKDIGKNLDEELKTDQLKRYLSSLHNFVLTDYLEFRWFVAGKLRLKESLGTHTKDGKIKRDADGIQKVMELLVNFLSSEPEPIGTPKELAHHLARLAHMVRDLTINTLKAELATGALHAQLIAFRDNLIPDLSIEQFADMYAQTIAYGLFAARCEADIGQDFTREKAGYLIPKTNPFLRKLFNHIAGPDLDEHIVGAVDDLAQILAQADMSAVMKGFGKSTGKEDPVVHFYETFLKEYDPKTREMRGVYYTPLPVVSYIVRSIDHILKTRFEKPQGLADPAVHILDPAVGTATFLYMVIQEIHNAIIQQGQRGTWNEYVKDKLLPRLFGFELLMAPYAIAHLKLGRLLKDTNYDFQTDQRLGIYLTNTLEEAVKHADTLFAQWITEEANAAADIKKTKPIMVVLGNPPYSVSSANKGKYIEELMASYKSAVRSERNIQPLSDDYLKFIRFAQDRIERTGHGIVGMITNNSYLSGLIHRGMREELLKSFNEIYILNLHGNALLQERTPEGTTDKNVFDIRVGVSIVLFVKKLNYPQPTQVYYADIWGQRESKYEYLASNEISVTDWEQLKPTTPYYFFLPMDTNLTDEYKKGWTITDIFPVNTSGIKTHHDDFVMDFDETALKNRITTFVETTYSDNEIRERYKLENQHGWSVTTARKTISQDKNWRESFTYCFYRPFDIRFLFYHKAVVERTRAEIMRHMIAGKNIGLTAMRQVALNDAYTHFAVTRFLVDNRVFYSNKGIPCLFPLYLYPPEKKEQVDKSGGKEGGTIEPLKLQENREPNLNPEFIKGVEKRLGVRFQPHPFPSPSTERGVDVAFSPSLQEKRELESEVVESRWRTEPQLWEKLKPLARQMRKEPTEAEELLWQRLRNHQLSGFKFRRQHSIERFIVDFYCSEAGLVIEIDGPIHQYQKEEDFIRQAYIESQGFRLLRFSNDDVLNKLDTVIQQIINALPHPHPSLQAERELEGEVVTPEDIFHYAYAIFHSPTYRKRYAEFLKIDFPRLPLTSNKTLFRSLAEKGAALVSLHLMESPLLNTPITKYPVSGLHEVEKVSYDEKTRRVYINKTEYFEGVPSEVWNFHIGGYQVCEKWLKDRKGRKLSVDDINHYQKIVIALKETIRLMAEIDALIPEWPIE